MKTPFLWISLGFTAGVLLGFFIKIPSFAVWCVFLSGVPFLWIYRGRKAFPPILFLLLAFLGMLSVQWRYARPVNAVEIWSGPCKINLEGTVRTMPQIQTYGRREKVSFVLSARNLFRSCGQKREYFEAQGDVQVFLIHPAEIPRYGDWVRVWGVLERPGPVLNPGGFDYGRYLDQRNIRAVFRGYGRSCLKILKSGGRALIFRGLIRLRDIVRARIEKLFHGNEAAFMKALVLGERRGIPGDLENDFVKTGTSHLLAISGMNIVLVVGSFYYFLIACRVRQKTAAAAAFLATWAYVFISGADFPVLRSGWMAGMGFLALLLDREKNSLNIFFLAFFALVFADPKSLVHVSFQLSFLSVFFLILSVRYAGGRWPWAEILMNTCVVMLGTFPLVIYYFNIFSPVSIGANLLAIPLFDLALNVAFAALFLGSVPGLGFLLVFGAEICLKGALAWIHFCSLVPWGYFYLAPPSFSHLVLYYFLLAILLVLRAVKPARPKWICAFVFGIWLAATAAFFCPGPSPAFGLTLLAAGKNEIAHLEFAPKIHWLVNAGRQFPTNQAERIVGPYLRSRGIKKLSAVFVTDFAQKHTGAMASLFGSFFSDYFFFPEGPWPETGFSASLKNKKINRVAMKAGDEIRFKKGGEISVIDIADGRVIFGVSYGGHCFLFLPSFDRSVLDKIESHRDSLARTEVLVLPSLKRFEADDFGAFFDRLDPVLVTIPHRLPEAEVFLKDRDIAFLDLEKYGALSFTISQNAFGKKRESILIRSMLRGKIAKLDFGKLAAL